MLAKNLKPKDYFISGANPRGFSKYKKSRDFINDIKFLIDLKYTRVDISKILNISLSTLIEWIDYGVPAGKLSINHKKIKDFINNINPIDLTLQELISLSDHRPGYIIKKLKKDNHNPKRIAKKLNVDVYIIDNLFNTGVKNTEDLFIIFNYCNKIKNGIRNKLTSEKNNDKINH